MMRKLLLFFLLPSLLCADGMAQVKSNQRDAQNRKQGYWVEQVAELRGEPGYTWEGVYKNDRKEGIWKKSSTMGNPVAEETYKNNVLDGYCKYYYPGGKLSEEGMYMPTEIEGQRDTILIIDPVTNAETPTEIIRKGNPVRNGVWKLYDEETGKMVKQYYKRGEVVTAADLGDSTVVDPPAVKEAPLQLPHEQTGKHKRKD